MQRNRTDYIVIHTAAWPGDPSIEDIRRVHVEENGWQDVGYHYLIRKDGHIEAGRDEQHKGAHCIDMGMNGRSIGICCSGHGDQEPFTRDQMMALAELVNGLRKEYDIPVDHVIGHRETGAAKTCPGTKVNMDVVRGYIEADGDYTLAHDETGTTINNVQTPDDANNNGLSDDLEETTAPDPIAYGDGADNKKFVNTWFGQLLKGKSKAGKVVYTVAGAALTFFTGINIDPVTNLLTGNEMGVLPQLTQPMEMDIWSIVLMAVGSLITIVTGRGLLKGLINEIVTELQDVIANIQKAREAGSDGGKTITKEEQLMILKEADDIAVILWNRLVRSRLLRFLGLDKKPEKGTS